MPTPTYDFITSFTATNASAVTITITSIPSTYRHLVVHWATRDTNGGYWQNAGYYWSTNGTDTRIFIQARYNDLGQPGNDFDWTFTDASGFTAAYHASTLATNTFHSGFMLAPNYSDTVKRITWSDGAQQYYTQFDVGELYSRSGWYYYSTANSLNTLTIRAQGTFDTGSSIFLYGLKSA